MAHCTLVARTPRAQVELSLMTRRDLAWAALLVVVVCALLLYLRAPRATYIKVGGGLPNLTLPILGAPGSQSIEGLRGLPLLLVFFDTKSDSAPGQIPKIQKLYSYFFPRTLRVVGVAVDSDAKAADLFLKEARVSFLVLSDPGAKAARGVFHIESFPEAYLVEQSGRVDAVFPGPVDWLTAEMDTLISRTLPRGSPRKVM
jgi:peroxiredoxin